ncbi:division/cell wall cluster transcriptional repressor MraZ [Candidatus Foliamicus sp.]
MFQGPANVTLDSKGRFGLPARYRQSLASATEGQVVCTVHPDRCVLIYQPKDWARISDALMQQTGVRDVQRLIVGFASEVGLDAAGRLRVPAELREYCGLERRATLLTLGQRFELWDAARWRQRALAVSAQSESLDAALRSVQL